MSEDIKRNDDGTVGNELDAVLAEAENADGGYTHKFKKPINWEGKEYTELHFDFEGLTGKDMLSIEKELMLTEGVSVVAPTMSTQFLFAMAARAAKTTRDIFMVMPLFDANKIRSKARSFLLSSEL